jgi:hypothetical protein
VRVTAQVIDQRERAAVDVDKHEIRGSVAEIRQGGIAGGGDIDLIPVGHQVVLQEGAGGFVLVGDQEL